MQEFCPRCGNARTGSFRFCRACQLDFDLLPPVPDEGAQATGASDAIPGPAPGQEPPSKPEHAEATRSASFPGHPAPPGVTQDVAAGMLELEKLRLKLIPFRIAGIAIGLAVWWFVLGPVLGGDLLPTAIALGACVFGGLYLGNVTGLSLLRR